MHSFTDNQNQTWHIYIDIPSRKRIREGSGFDVFAVVEPGEVEKLSDPETLVAVLFSACKDQAEKLGLNPEQFAARFSGDVLDEAGKALMRAIADFFPKRQRDLIMAVLATTAELEQATTTAAMQKLATLATTPPRELSAVFGNSPGSSESTPTTNAA